MTPFNHHRHRHLVTGAPLALDDTCCWPSNTSSLQPRLPPRLDASTDDFHSLNAPVAHVPISISRPIATMACDLYSITVHATAFNGLLAWHTYITIDNMTTGVRRQVTPFLQSLIGGPEHHEQGACSVGSRRARGIYIYWIDGSTMCVLSSQIRPTTIRMQKDIQTEDI